MSKETEHAQLLKRYRQLTRFPETIDVPVVLSLGEQRWSGTLAYHYIWKPGDVLEECVWWCERYNGAPIFDLLSSEAMDVAFDEVENLPSEVKNKLAEFNAMITEVLATERAFRERYGYSPLDGE